MAPLIASNDRIDLWPAGTPGGPPAQSPEKVITDDGWTRIANVQVPSITVFRAAAATSAQTAVVICPGGGYRFLAVEHEGRDLAEWLASRGVTAFVLRYRQDVDAHPAPLKDVLRAIRLVRSRATDFSLQPDRIGVLGFSAGGHLASTAATLFDGPEGRAGDDLDAISARPDFAALIYPVITLEAPFSHTGSREALLGVDADPALVARMSTHRAITATTPPLFIVHADDDNVVPVENALLFHEAARAAGVPVEMHLFERGGHGFGMRPNSGAVSIWPELFLGWMRQRGWAR